MDMDEVEVVGAEHSAQTDDPAGVPRARGAEAADRPTAGCLEAGSQRRFPCQEVCNGGLDERRIAPTRLLDEQPFGASGPEPLDQPKNRKRRVKSSARALGGAHAR